MVWVSPQVSSLVSVSNRTWNLNISPWRDPKVVHSHSNNNAHPICYRMKVVRQLKLAACASDVYARVFNIFWPTVLHCSVHLHTTSCQGRPAEKLEQQYSPHRPHRPCWAPCTPLFPPWVSSSYWVYLSVHSKGNNGKKYILCIISLSYYETPPLIS